MVSLASCAKGVQGINSGPLQGLSTHNYLQKEMPNMLSNSHQYRIWNKRLT